MSDSPPSSAGGSELSPSRAAERMLPALHTALHAALVQGTSYAQLPPEALAQLVRRLIQALRHGLRTGDCGPLLTALDPPSDVTLPVRLGTLSDTQALLSILRRCGFAAVRSELLPAEESVILDLLDRFTDLLTQTAACDAQRRLGEMQNYALQQTQQSESMTALNEATTYTELMDIAVHFLAPLHSAHALLVLFAESPAAPQLATVAAAWSRQRKSPFTIGDVLELRTSPLTPVLQAETLLIIEDLARATELPLETVQALQSEQYAALVVAPLFLRDRLLGSLVLGWQEPRRFGFHDGRLLRAIADQSSTVAARLFLLSESALRFTELAALRDRLADQVAEQTAELRVFKALADNAPDAIFVASSDGKTLSYANPAFHAMLQLTSPALGPVHWNHIAESPARLHEIGAQLITHGLWQGQLRYRCTDGSFLPAHLSTFLVRGSPQSARIAGIARDISAEQRAEQERIAFKEQIITSQQLALRELGTPIIPVIEGVIVMPLIGALDEARAAQVVETLLLGVTASRAHTAIVDITGVKSVDTHTAGALLRATQAVRLLGARVLLTGLRAEVAQTLVSLGLDLSGLLTMATLQSAIAWATRDVAAR